MKIKTINHLIEVLRDINKRANHQEATYESAYRVYKSSIETLIKTLEGIEE